MGTLPPVEQFTVLCMLIFSEKKLYGHLVNAGPECVVSNYPIMYLQALPISSRVLTKDGSAAIPNI